MGIMPNEIFENPDAKATNKDIIVPICLEACAYSEHPLVTLDRYGLGRELCQGQGC